MPAIKIPGADQIEQVAPVRDPGVTATPDEFGANIGVSAEHFGDALTSLGAHLYAKQQKATEDAWVQTNSIDAAANDQQAIYDNRKAFPKGDADGGTASQDDLKARLAASHAATVASTTAKMGAPTSAALFRVNGAAVGRQSDALVQGVTFGNNQQLIGKQTTLNDNATLLASQVLSSNMPLDKALSEVDANAAAGKGIYSDSQLVDQKDKWQKAVVAAAIKNRYLAGDKAGGDAIRDKYFGYVPKPSGLGQTELPGDIGAKIDAEAIAQGVDPMMARKFAQIESNGDARAGKGKYKGIFQLSDEGFAAHGGTGDIFNADQNIKAGIHSLKADADAFQAKYGRAPSATELYLSHQQGQGGLAAQLANPDAPAWQNMASTAEGRAKGDAWAKLAIWGNIPDSQKAKFGSVDNITGKQFMDLWKQRVEGGGAVKVASADGTGGGADDGVKRSEPLLPDPEAALHWEQQSTVISGDIKQAEAKKQAAIEAQSAAEQFNVFKDMHSANPTMTADDILNNPKLTPATAMQMASLKLAPKNNGEGYGTGYVDLYQRVHLPPGDPQRVSDPAAIYPLAKAGGPLTPAGADKLIADINEKKSFEGASRQGQISEFLKGVKDHITGQDLGIGIKDPQGEQLYANYHVAFDTALAKALAKGDKPLGELLSGDGPLFKLSENYRRKQADWYSQLLQDNPQAAGATKPAPGGKEIPNFDIRTIKSLDDLKAAAKRGDVSNRQANQYAVGMGWASNGPVNRPLPPVSQ